MDWLPGSNLLRQAWDATKLAEAIQGVRRLFEAGDYEGLSRSLRPGVVVDKSQDLVKFWWRTWDL